MPRKPTSDLRARHVEHRAEAAEAQPRADRAEQVPPVQEARGGEGQVLEHVDERSARARLRTSTGMCQIHIAADVGDDAERGMPERAGRALDPLDAPRDRAQDVLRQRRASGRSARGRRAAGAGPCGSTRTARPRRSIGEISATNSSAIAGAATARAGRSRRRPRPTLARARCASARRRSTTYAASAIRTIGAKVQPASTGTPARTELARTRRAIVTIRAVPLHKCRASIHGVTWLAELRGGGRAAGVPGVPARAARARTSGCARRACARCRGCAAGARAAGCRAHRGRGCPAARGGVLAGVGADGLRGRRAGAGGAR